jgi:hypothetical protein
MVLPTRPRDGAIHAGGRSAPTARGTCSATASAACSTPATLHSRGHARQQPVSTQRRQINSTPPRTAGRHSGSNSVTDGSLPSSGESFAARNGGNSPFVDYLGTAETTGRTKRGSNPRRFDPTSVDPSRFPPDSAEWYSGGVPRQRRDEPLAGSLSHTKQPAVVLTL